MGDFSACPQSYKQKMFKSKFDKKLEQFNLDNADRIVKLSQRITFVENGLKSHKEKDAEAHELLDERLDKIEDRQAIKDHDYKRSQKNREFMRQIFIQAVPWLLVAVGVLFQIGSKLYHAPSPDQKYYAKLESSND